LTPVPLTDDEYRLFREWLTSEYGLWFGPERREILRSRLEPRRAELGFDSFHQLFFFLKFHPEREAERQRLIPHLTNNESYFFRERKQLEVFRDSVLPLLRERLAKERRTELRILSAGCSGGQEPYTLALLLREARAALGALQPRITGVDLDPRILEQARGGRFTAHSFRGVDDAVREQHFRRTAENEWEILPAVRGMVTFQPANLSDPAWAASLPPQDVIFCRNVLIYFDAEGLHRAARGLHDALVDDGYLFLGHAESLSRVPTPFAPERHPGALFYRKVEG
jgi:chemotaxis protein methyltransferase CheR